MGLSRCMRGILERREKLLAATLIILFFLLNYSIATRSPFGAWMDEVTYVDPGLNLAAGKGWTSSVWPWQTDHQFWAANSPLYPGALSVWARVFGISMVSARSYCYFLSAVGMFMLWLGAYRFNLLTPAYRLFWIIFLSTEYGMNWMARDERYDVWIFLGLALAWLGASMKSTVFRYPLIFLGCLIVPLAGFVGVPYVVLVASLATVLTRFKYWKEAVTGVAAASFGVVGVVGFFASFGQLQAFRTAVSHQSEAGGQFASSLIHVFLYPLDDRGVMVMIGMLLILTVYFWKKAEPAGFSWLALGWGIVVIMPVVMLLRGVFVMMYFYMVIIPLSLAILQLAVRSRTMTHGRYMTVLSTLLLGLLCLGGLPARVYSSLAEWDFRNPAHMRDFIQTYVHPDDRVFSDYPFYFELRDRVKLVATHHYIYAIPPDEAARIDVAIVSDKDFPNLTLDASGLRSIGGGWEKVAVFPTPEMTARSRAVMPGNNSYTLYRRQVAQP